MEARGVWLYVLNTGALLLNKVFTGVHESLRHFFSEKYDYSELKKSEKEYFSALKQQNFNLSYQNFDVIIQDKRLLLLLEQ